MTTACPLCGASEHRSLAVLDPAVLRDEYRDQFDVAITVDGVDRIDYRLCGKCDLRFFLPAVAGGEDFYRQLQKIPWYYRDEKAEYDIAAAYLQPTDAVLEIGAGKGVFSRHIRCASYIGLEMSPDAIATARQSGIELSDESIETHAARNPGRYDVVCAFQVLEHVPSVLSFLQSAAQCLRAHGRLIVAVPSEDSFARIDFWDILNMPPHHVTRWSDRCLRNLGGILGLRVVAIEHEPLPDRDVRWCARLLAEYGMAVRRGHEPTLLDPFTRRWLIRRGGKFAASIVRRALSNPALRPVGHSVVAVLQKDA